MSPLTFRNIEIALISHAPQQKVFQIDNCLLSFIFDGRAAVMQNTMYFLQNITLHLAMYIAIYCGITFQRYDQVRFAVASIL